MQQVAVLRAEKQAMRTRMATLEDDIKAHRIHVQRVKQQISAVCQQDVCSENKVSFSSLCYYKKCLPKMILIKRLM